MHPLLTAVKAWLLVAVLGLGFKLGAFLQDELPVVGLRPLAGL
jgi:hypothetical protein